MMIGGASGPADPLGEIDAVEAMLIERAEVADEVRGLTEATTEAARDGCLMAREALQIAAAYDSPLGIIRAWRDTLRAGPPMLRAGDQPALFEMPPPRSHYSAGM